MSRDLMMNFYKTLQIWSLLWTLVLNELDRYVPLLIWTFHSMNRTYKEDFYRGASLYFGLIKPSATIKNTPVSFFVSLLVCMNMWERERSILALSCDQSIYYMYNSFLMKIYITVEHQTDPGLILKFLQLVLFYILVY
jgi:hypothetical protein